MKRARKGIVTVRVDGVPIRVQVEIDNEEDERIRESVLENAPPGILDIQFGPRFSFPDLEERVDSAEYRRSRYIPRPLRREVVERDRVCQDCGGKGEHVHHLSYVTPVTIDDLVYLCETCHAERHSALIRPIRDAAFAAFERGETATDAHVPGSAKKRAPWPLTQ